MGEEAAMKCPHCLTDFHDQWHQDLIRWPEQRYGLDDPDGNWSVRSTKCPACERATIVLRSHLNGRDPRDRTVWPRATSRPPLPTEVKDPYRKDYHQAVLILADSPEASAALSRRCLQRLLRAEAGVKPGKLYTEIQAAVDSQKLPSYVSDALLHAIRHFGNFGAHAETDVNTNEIIEVEPGEAEWCLDILDILFDFYFVQPSKTEARLKQLQEKLARKG
jgi:hypothetical protein